MKIGHCNNPRKNITEEVRWIGENGFEFVDLFLEPDRALPESMDVRALKELLKQYSLHVVSHTAWYLPLGSPLPELRREAVRIVKGYFRFLERLDCRFLTVHANWPCELFSAEEGIQFQVESLARITESAREFGVRILYEPLDGPRDTLRNLSRIVKEVPDLLVHLDIGHANITGIQPSAYFNTFGDRVAHIHLHDNNGVSDLHLPLGAGKINWKQTIRQIRKGYDGTITLEIFSRDKDYVLLSKEKLRQLWEEAGAEGNADR